jgi:hypothetical protein
MGAPQEAHLNSYSCTIIIILIMITLQNGKHVIAGSENKIRYKIFQTQWGPQKQPKLSEN